MPIKKTTPEGPKAKLMKQTIPALRKKAKALGVSDYTKRTKENLVQSIMLAEARKKRGTGMAGRKAKLKPVPQKKVGEYVYGKDGRRVKSVTSMPTGVLNTPETFENNYRIRKFQNSHTPSKADKGRFAMRPGKRISKNGNVYYEYRGNRADGSIIMHGDEKYQGWTNYWTWKYYIEFISGNETRWIEFIEDDAYESLFDLAYDIREDAEEFIASGITPDFAQSWFLAALSFVNWREIAQSVAEGTNLK